MSTYEIVSLGEGRRPAFVFLMDGLGCRAALKSMAEWLASHGYDVLLPDLYHREGKHVHFDRAVLTQPESMRLGESCPIDRALRATDRIAFTNGPRPRA